MINHSMRCLRRMLRIAHEEGRIASVPKIPMLAEPEARQGYIETEKFEELLAVLPPRLRPLILFYYYGGGRKGEALKIEWPQVDPMLGLVRVTPAQTKTKQGRNIPLHARLLPLLAEIEPKTGRVFEKKNLRVEWERPCAAVGLATREKMTSPAGNVYYKYQGLMLHDFRRSAVRNLSDAGVPQKVIMEISGHKTVDVFNRYNIVSKENVLNAMRKLEQAELNGPAQNGASLVRASRVTARRRLLKTV